MSEHREEVRKSWEEAGGRPDPASWFRRGGVTGVLQVPASGKERILNKVCKIMDAVPGPGGQKAKVLERPGPSVRSQLVVSDPNPRKVCSRPLCPLNNEEKYLNKCFNESVGYSITCRRCLEASRSGGPPPRVYIGETHRSLYTRFQGHLGDLKAALKHSREGKSGSWMASHIREAHGGLHNEANPGLDWVASLGGQHPKPLVKY